MQKSERKEYFALMGILGETYHETLSEGRIDLYWSVLKQFDFCDLKRAAEYILTTRVYTSFPMPADFINFLHPPEDLELRAANALNELRDRLNDPYRSFCFSDPITGETVHLMGGWKHVSETFPEDPQDQRFWLKDFEKIFKARAGKPVPNESRRMVGILENFNTSKGYLTDAGGNPVFDDSDNPIMLESPKSRPSLPAPEDRKPKSMKELLAAPF